MLHGHNIEIDTPHGHVANT